ncbi:MAG: hypothetical protein Q7S31_02380 [bacterium]|nr:hypothetical protein [bacterium]
MSTETDPQPASPSLFDLDGIDLFYLDPEDAFDIITFQATRSQDKGLPLAERQLAGGEVLGALLLVTQVVLVVDTPEDNPPQSPNEIITNSLLYALLKEGWIPVDFSP